jgi:hypothetical protein
MPGLKARTKALREQAIAKANAEAKKKVEDSLKKLPKFGPEIRPKLSFSPRIGPEMLFRFGFLGYIFIQSFSFVEMTFA